LCGKGCFSDGFWFLVRNLSVWVRIDEDFGVFRLEFGGVRFFFNFLIGVDDCCFYGWIGFRMKFRIDLG